MRRAIFEISLSDEVAASFWVPLSTVRDPSAWGTGTVMVRDQQRSEAVFRVHEHLVWGLTERVLRQLRETL